MAKRERPDQFKPWSAAARPHYIRLFSLQERLRVHLKMAQELARKSYQVKYPDNPRKTNPIRLAGKPDDYLKKYREDQWPEIKHYLLHMREEIRQIKAAYKGGRPPKWLEQIIGAEAKEVAGKWVPEIIGVEELTEQIWEKMELIQAHLIITLQGNGQALKESNKVIIEDTAEVLGLARDIREALLFVPLDEAKIGLDEYGFEAIIDLSQPIILDLSLLWQRSRAKNKRG